MIGAIFIPLILLMFLAAFFVAVEERGQGGILRKFLALPRKRKLVAMLMLCVLSAVCGDKSAVKLSVWRLMFWDPLTSWLIQGASDAADQAERDVGETEAIIEEAEDFLTNDVLNISFDWHVPDRLPYHERQNVLAWTCKVAETNIGGVLCEDHYVAFNATASTNPAVIEVEYAATMPDGSIYRETSNVITSSYPETSVVELQSGSHTCYWFRCAVPAFARDRARDWCGEALFGAPSGSAHGFDMLGVLHIDTDNNVWVGRTGEFDIGGSHCVFSNGVCLAVTEVQQ